MNYDRQLLAWAVDRAIETLKHGGEKFTPDDVKATAESYAEWISKPDDEVVADDEQVCGPAEGIDGGVTSGEFVQ